MLKLHGELNFCSEENVSNVCRPTCTTRKTGIRVLYCAVAKVLLWSSEWFLANPSCGVLLDFNYGVLIAFIKR